MLTIDEYATLIIRDIVDVASGWPPMRHSKSFEDMNCHVDANCFMIDAEVPFDLEDEATTEFYVAVQEEVERRLKDGAIYEGLSGRVDLGGLLILIDRDGHDYVKHDSGELAYVSPCCAAHITCDEFGLAVCKRCYSVLSPSLTALPEPVE